MDWWAGVGEFRSLRSNRSRSLLSEVVKEVIGHAGVSFDAYVTNVGSVSLE